MLDAEFEADIGRAADLLTGKNCVIVAGLSTDVAGCVAAIRLAERLGGAFDHAGAEAAFAEIDALRDAGLMLVSPGEARARADLWLVIGDGPLDAMPWTESVRTGGALGATAARDTIRLSSAGLVDSGKQSAEIFRSTGQASIPGLLGALRARADGRPLTADFDSSAIDRCVVRLEAAKFGVAVWRSGEVDALTVEMIAGLVKDLNAKTRWSALAIGGDASASVALQVSGWMTGLPFRTGFGRGASEHDPWRFEARRLVESGEADAALWVSTFGEPAPDWLGGVPAVVISDRDAAAAVALRVGRPGRDHDAILFEPLSGALAERRAATPAAVPTAAAALNAIRDRLAS